MFSTLYRIQRERSCIPFTDDMPISREGSVAFSSSHSRTYVRTYRFGYSRSHRRVKRTVWLTYNSWTRRRLSYRSAFWHMDTKNGHAKFGGFGQPTSPTTENNFSYVSEFDLWLSPTSPTWTFTCTTIKVYTYSLVHVAKGKKSHEGKEQESFLFQETSLSDESKFRSSFFRLKIVGISSPLK